MEEATQTVVNDQTDSSTSQEVEQTRPEWLPEKFETPESLVQSYGELESKIGQKDETVRDQFLQELEQEFYNGRPASVGDYKIPESIDEELAQDNEMFNWWANEAFENGYSQEEFEAGVEKFAEFMHSRQPDIEAEYAKLGDNAQARLVAVTLWTQNNFTEEEFGAIQNLASTAEGIGVLEKIMEMQKNSSLSGHATQPASLNQDDLDEMMRDPRYWKPGERDQNFVNKVTDGFNKLYGS